MGSNTIAVPFIHLTNDPKTLEAGTDEWKLASQRVCDAFETDGCILVRYDRISGADREELMAALRSLFDLPFEAKARNPRNATLPKSIPQVPLYESQGAMNAVDIAEAEAFTRLMWPQSNDKFCQTINSMGNKMLGVLQIILDMICDRYGVSREETRIGRTDALLHMIKYSAQEAEAEGAALGMPGHTDFNYLTALCQNEVEGLMVKSKEGGWIPVELGSGDFVVFAGEALRAWSNGRLHPAYHQVFFSGLKDRLCCGLFLKPKDDQVIEPAPAFVDDGHPLRYKPFVYDEFHQHRKTAYGDGENILQKYYGV